MLVATFISLIIEAITNNGNKKGTKGCNLTSAFNDRE
jgi:hypothetical protein